jgi:hypothetical protein
LISNVAHCIYEDIRAAKPKAMLMTLEGRKNGEKNRGVRGVLSCYAHGLHRMGTGGWLCSLLFEQCKRYQVVNFDSRLGGTAGKCEEPAAELMQLDL